MKSIIILSAVVLVIIFSALYGDKIGAGQNQDDLKSSLLEISPVYIELGTREIPPGWSEYHSDQYSVSFFYPSSMKIKEVAEGGGASSIIFEDIENNLGFQIFIVPYGEEKVSNERFLKDVPSGVRKDVASVEIDGANATSFSSQNIALGETWEVWFIHGGYLYEVTTLKVLKPFLESVIKTWKFL